MAFYSAGKTKVKSTKLSAGRPFVRGVTESSPAAGCALDPSVAAEAEDNDTAVSEFFSGMATKQRNEARRTSSAATYGITIGSDDRCFTIAISIDESLVAVADLHASLDDDALARYSHRTLD
jgi:hypothetical protein